MKKIFLLAITGLFANATGATVLNSDGFDNGTFTFSKKELSDLSKIIFELGFASTEISKLHTIHEGIVFNEQIVLANSRGLLGQKVTGCTPSATNGIKLSEKLWTPVLEDFRMTHCSATVNTQDKLINQMKKINPDYYNIFEGSQNRLGQFLIASLLERLSEELLRKAWFNDTAGANVDDGGTISDGLDIKFFNSFNGLFKQFLSNATLMATKRVTITENAGATYALQALPDNKGRDYLRAVYKLADQRLRSHPNSQFYVTQEIWDSYLDFLESVENSGAGNVTTTTDGKTILKYRGKELIVMGVWDRTIQEYYDNGTKWDKPNRIVFSTADNLPIATLAKSDFTTLDAFYDKVTKMNYIDGAYSIDSKILEDYMVVMAL